MSAPEPGTTDELAVTRQTIENYAGNTEQFWRGTRDHDVSQNIATLLQSITASPPFSILDLGCGPGRDLKTFSDLGHRAIGLEGVPRFAEMAREYSGCEVWEQNFIELELPPSAFDGVFANAALFHVPRTALPRVLQVISTSLKPGGVLFTSNPHGNDHEGWNRGRYGSFHSLQTWRSYLERAGFEEITHYYRPAGLPREQQPWLAVAARKLST